MNRFEEKYDPAKIESKWQAIWQKENLWPSVDGDSREKYYLLVEFPYPSGAGLHVGHVRSYASMDAFARYKRMKGFNVLYPMGWDAFGLPAENYALKMGVHPSKTVAENINRFRKQCQQLGLSFDWPREINTTDPKYYRWTQWIFLKLLEKGLAYRQAVTINWCPACKTNLADEEVLADGTHERCGKATERRAQEQWLLKITSYADRLLTDLNLVNYSPKIRIQQENWIGRKDWIDITYPVDGTEETIVVSTTRPETNFGATFIVIAPEHPLVARLLNSSFSVIPATEPESIPSGSRIKSGMTKDDEVKLDKIKVYVESALKKSELERISEGRKKTGVFTGLYAVNRLNNKKMPIYITDFVLMNVGTGAVVGVPGHDRRDFEFAESFDLPVIRVVSDPKGSQTSPKGENTAITRKDQVWEGEGMVVNSDFLNSLETGAAITKIMDYLEEKGWGKRVTRYHLRDWVFSRQHYWGEPIPVVYCANCVKVEKGVSLKRRLLYKVVPVPEEDLPVELPYVERYEPSGTGESPLAKMDDWVKTTCPVCGGPAQRETDTMPNWAGSNWYYLAYLFADKLSVIPASSAPIGGTKAGIQDSGSRLSSRSDWDFGPPRPASLSLQRGELDILVEAGRDDTVAGVTNIFIANKNVLDYWMPVDLYQGGFEHTTLHLLYSRFIYKFLYDLGVVPTPEPYARRHSHGIVLGADGRKMSKSFGNVVNPEEIIAKYGADALRLYEMFLGPFDQAVAWSDESLAGCRRFLDRVWRLHRDNPPETVTPLELKRKLHRTVKKVTGDIENLKFNTAVAAFMEFINDWSAALGAGGGLSREDLGLFLRLLAPFAPHISEELWVELISADYGQISADGKPASADSSVHQQPWPTFDPSLVTEEIVTIIIQVNGKKRASIELTPTEANFSDEAEKTKVLAKVNLISQLSPFLSRGIKQTIFVPHRLINFVV